MKSEHGKLVGEIIEAKRIKLISGYNIYDDSDEGSNMMSPIGVSIRIEWNIMKKEHNNMERVLEYLRKLDCIHDINWHENIDILWLHLK
jgi:hypothetical protein